MILSLTLLIIPAYPQSFTQFIDKLNNLPEELRQKTLDSFFTGNPKTPLIENDTTIHFIYRGEAVKVLLAGDVTNWQPEIPLKHISGTDLWYVTCTYEPDARLDYKIVVNDTLWMPDPLNPDICMSGFGPNSTFHMPGYHSPPETAFYPGIPHGTLADTTVYSAFLKNSRNIRIYLPSGYEKGNKEYPVMLFHDGLEYLSLANAGNILDYLIAEKMIVPVIGVFVPPVTREPEYVGELKDSYRRFIVEELMPFIDTKYRTRKDPAGRAMTGISNGGYISLYIGISNPEAFGNISAQSSNYDETLFELYEKGKASDMNVYIDMGSYDIPKLVERVRQFLNILDAKDYQYNYYEFPEGHSWCNWEGHLRLPLMQFFKE
jgi:enterochelin esterase family protein